MTDNEHFDEVEDLVSLEALSVMAAALSPDENAPSDDAEPKEGQSASGSDDTSAFSG
ncbi:hypothetical protein H8B09_25075 [Paenibacillus sp. PR3]|uniref:Uncharacterized protein n=1 Tax=Paenibacillus terricola TaxID=2763503 RepID=A0ABR8N1K4_9BACL|nr:hypothetical protein [Paenibacillus terricola]MBD3922059.1 hypothetical protein [Paenibacillus terricola]